MSAELADADWGIEMAMARSESAYNATRAAELWAQERGL